MLLFDYRMVEGQPLHYYYPFNTYYPELSVEMEEDLTMPLSPSSTQSDSDNSLSSIELSPKPIQARTVITHTPKNETRCCWKSCGIIFESLDQLAYHVSRTHASSGPGGLFYCGWEGCSRNSKGFNARYKMLVHVRTHTNEKPHQCFLCDKSFSRAENLKIHSRSHSGEKPYVCTVPGCNKAYSNSSDRFKHTRTHQVEKPYQCKVPGCPKRYTDPSSLRKHVKTYKHFVHKNQPTANDNMKNNTRSKEMETQTDKVQERVKNNSYDCTHLCSVPPRKNKTFRIGAFINVNRNERYQWDKYFSPEHKNVFFPFNVEGTIDVDLPLDLSVNRKVT